VPDGLIRAGVQEAAETGHEVWFEADTKVYNYTQGTRIHKRFSIHDLTTEYYSSFVSTNFSLVLFTLHLAR
jgi:hypothetical protein